MIAWSEKNVDRESHAIERIEDLNRGAQNEGRKLFYDWFKHLTTLGTGSIVILGSLLNNILSSYSEWKWLIPVTFISLFVAVVGALIVMYLIQMVFLAASDVGQQVTTDKPQKRLGRYLRLAIWPTLLLFSIGILSLVVFVLINLL